jgi:hypothetical protein
MDVSSLSAYCIDKVKVGLVTQVGNAFVNQYYNVLHQSPLVVHRFYTDASRLTRAEAGTDGAVDTVVTQTVCIINPSLTKLSLHGGCFSNIQGL